MHRDVYDSDTIKIVSLVDNGDDACSAFTQMHFSVSTENCANNVAH